MHQSQRTIAGRRGRRRMPRGVGTGRPLLRAYSMASFPSSTVYGPTSNAALRLITCGGDFDPTTGHYLGSTVVFASLTSSRAS